MIFNISKVIVYCSQHRASCLGSIAADQGLNFLFALSQRKVYSQWCLIRPKNTWRFSVELKAGFNIVDGVCPGKSVELSGLIELTLVELSGADCTYVSVVKKKGLFILYYVATH